MGVSAAMGQTGISVVFAGGGCRTFWGLGLYDELKVLLPPVAEWSGTSAGSAMAIAAASGRTKETLDRFVEATASNPRNFYPEWLLRGRRPLPHNDMYRRTLTGILEQGAWDSLRKAGPVRILLAYIREGHPAVSTWVKAVWHYERRKQNLVHGPDTPIPGLGYRVVTVQEADSVPSVVDWVLSASSTPPLTDIHRYEGQPYVDGGLVDNVPVRALSEASRQGKTLVILSRPAPPELLPAEPRRLYLAPSAPVPVSKWDYTSPAKLRSTFDLGRADADRYREVVKRFLET